jgi:signal transduction histidine kinase
MTTTSGIGAAVMTQENNSKLRTLAHDLSNSIETIMQASYLLAQSNLDDTSKKWLELIDNATREAARINREIREILRAQSAPAA